MRYRCRCTASSTSLGHVQVPIRDEARYRYTYLCKRAFTDVSCLVESVYLLLLAQPSCDVDFGAERQATAREPEGEVEGPRAATLPIIRTRLVTCMYREAA